MSKNNWVEVPKNLSDKTLTVLIELRNQAISNAEKIDSLMRLHIDALLKEYSNLKPLSMKQYSLLAYIIDEYKNGGICPTIHEMSEYMELTSENSVFSLVDALCKKGYIKKTPRKWRSIIPLYDCHKNRVLLNNE